MDRISVENFRCFSESQSIRLAPLTLLVGENSTGKTSLLALVRILSEISEGITTFDFKAPPYDLGSFDDIIHSRGGPVGRSNSFSVSYESYSTRSRRSRARQSRVRVTGTFRKRGSAPTMVRRQIESDSNSIDERVESDIDYSVTLATQNGTWELSAADEDRRFANYGDFLFYIHRAFRRTRAESADPAVSAFVAKGKSPPIGQDDLATLEDLAAFRLGPHSKGRGTFASAPVRSKPRRTYDPARLDPDPDGDYVPMYLADLFLQQKQRWDGLKDHLEDFGREAGLFDEISIRPLGHRGSEPFQIQVRRGDGRRKGQWRNLIDVGYGISQVLPVITELMRANGPRQFLLQQPEVHLHPQAQAALGSLLGRIASSGRQIVVETHSDHLMDRVRMDVRDRTSGISPRDVSVLYFERAGLDVRVHSLGFDENGNVDPEPSAEGEMPEMPESYRRFFMEETRRSLGL